MSFVNVLHAISKDFALYFWVCCYLVSIVIRGIRDGGEAFMSDILV